MIFPAHAHTHPPGNMALTTDIVRGAGNKKSISEINLE